MKSAYLYIRVSTDEQKRKGYSLPEQEDRLVKYCQFNNIHIEGIYREDFSAKNFNRPEWKKLVSAIRRNASKKSNNILFVKWDRFSRNIEYAYEMIGILRKLRTTATAIDQPIDFDIPESSVMLAVYLSIPEAENGRRALNTSNGIRRAKQLGRYPSKAPLGYVNLTLPNGKKYIAPKQPEADLMRWSFQQLAKNSFAIEEIRRMVNAKGLKCSRSNFWRQIRNPTYCGIIIIQPRDNEEPQFIKGVHEPIISEGLFSDVQNVIKTKRKIKGKTDELKAFFTLRGYLVCPVCDRKLTGSFCKGHSKKYPYYHCNGKCGTRFRADLINDLYDKLIENLVLSSGVADLFKRILDDVNTATQRAQYLEERKILLEQIEEQEKTISKARILYLSEKFEFDDFSSLKKEYHTLSEILKSELDKVTIKLARLNKHLSNADELFSNVLLRYKDFDLADKKQIINLISPVNLDRQAGTISSVQIDNALSKILSCSCSLITIRAAPNDLPSRFSNRTVSIGQAITLLGRNDIHVNGDEAAVILDFLYVIAKNYNKPEIGNQIEIKLEEIEL